MNEKLSVDEWRLIRFFRCLSAEKQSSVLSDVGAQTMEECITDKSIYELMPEAAGVRPEGIDYINDKHSIAYVIHCGIEETGDPKHYLLGTSVWDEEETIPRFVRGAGRAALEQNSFFNYDEDFARDYINAWRNEIVNACIQHRNHKLSIETNQLRED